MSDNESTLLRCSLRPLLSVSLFLLNCYLCSLQVLAWQKSILTSPFCKGCSIKCLINRLKRWGNTQKWHFKRRQMTIKFITKFFLYKNEIVIQNNFNIIIKSWNKLMKQPSVTISWSICRKFNILALDSCKELKIIVNVYPALWLLALNPKGSCNTFPYS